MTGKDLLDMILAEGVEVKERHEDLIKEFDKALNENRVYFIPKNNNAIGFLTYEAKIKEGKKKLLINKLVILKKYRHTFSLIALRCYIRNLYRNMKCDEFYFRSKRRNRICYLT